MQIIFRNTRTNQELAMPVMPAEFAVEEGRQVESLNMTDAGQVNLPGLQALFNERLQFLLPVSARTYTAGGYAGDPYAVVETLTTWSLDGDVLRMIVTGTPVNVPVLLGPVRHGQQDGTGDVYVTLTLRQYRELTAETTEITGTGNLGRSTVRETQAETAYTVVKGDTMWGIARKYYGDGTLAYKLASYNGIKNANLIYPGQAVKIPDKSNL